MLRPFQLAISLAATGLIWSQSNVPATIAENPASLARGRQLLQRVQQALGGTAKLLSIRDVTETFELQRDLSQGGLAGKQVNRFVLPNHMRQERAQSTGRFILYSDGTSGWLATPQGMEPMSSQILGQAQAELFRQRIALMLSDRDASRTVNAVGETSIVISDKRGDSARIDFNRETGLPARQVYRAPSSTGSVLETVETLSDWRKADGIMMPYKMVIQEQDAKPVELTVSEYRFNTGLTVEDLSRRP